MTSRNSGSRSTPPPRGGKELLQALARERPLGAGPRHRAHAASLRPGSASDCEPDRHRLALHLVDGGTLVGGDGLAAVLQRHLRHGAVHEGEQRLLDDHVEAQLLLAHDLDLGGDRRDDRVGEEDAGEGADQRRADQMAQHLRRLVERAHGLDDAEHRGDDAERRERLGDRHHRVIGLQLVVLDGLDLLVHQRLDLVRAGIADDDEAAVVADERQQLLVLGDARKPLEDRRLAGIVEVALDLVARLAAQIAHEGEQHAQHVQVVAGRGGGVGQGLDDADAAVLDRLHRVGDDERAERRAADDDVLPRLPDHADVAAHGHEAAEQAAERDDETDEDRHVMAPGLRRGHPSVSASSLREPDLPRVGEGLDVRLGQVAAANLVRPPRAIRWKNFAIRTPVVQTTLASYRRHQPPT